LSSDFEKTILQEYMPPSRKTQSRFSDGQSAIITQKNGGQRSQSSQMRRMIYLPGMKSLAQRFRITGIALLALLVAAFAQTTAIQTAHQSDITGAALVFQITSTPEPEDLSEIGSTDGIVAMGGVIALIIIIPILVRYQYWARASSQ
jgi:hypothetical protein